MSPPSSSLGGYLAGLDAARFAGFPVHWLGASVGSAVSAPANPGLDMIERENALAVLEFTRLSAWMDADEGVVCGVEPIRG